MEALLASAIGVLFAVGVYLVLRARTFPVALGITFLGYGVNLMLFASGGLRLDAPPIVGNAAAMSDPLPQALVLTVIVIGFGMIAFLLALAVRAHADRGNDHVDGTEGGT
jgi:multisubunit Na+/H+ antiporter MnhC subunit